MLENSFIYWYTYLNCYARLTRYDTISWRICLIWYLQMWRFNFRFITLYYKYSKLLEKYLNIIDMKFNSIIHVISIFVWRGNFLYKCHLKESTFPLHIIFNEVFVVCCLSLVMFRILPWCWRFLQSLCTASVMFVNDSLLSLGMICLFIKIISRSYLNVNCVLTQH